MTPTRDSALDRPLGRDAAMLADTLRNLQAQLEAPAEPSAAQVEELVSQAVAALQRVRDPLGHAVAGTVPVLGAGVVQELLRQRREGPVVAGDAPPTVDTRR